MTRDEVESSWGRDPVERFPMFRSWLGASLPSRVAHFSLIESPTVSLAQAFVSGYAIVEHEELAAQVAVASELFTQTGPSLALVAGDAILDEIRRMANALRDRHHHDDHDHEHGDHEHDDHIDSDGYSHDPSEHHDGPSWEDTLEEIDRLIENWLNEEYAS